MAERHEPAACQRCHYLLDVEPSETVPAPVRYRHMPGFPDDHMILPTTASSLGAAMNWTCQICAAAPVVWRYNVHGMFYPTTRTWHPEIDRFWSLCITCADHLEEADIVTLARRHAASLGFGPAHIPELVVILGTTFDNADGSRYYLEQGPFQALDPRKLHRYRDGAARFWTSERTVGAYTGSEKVMELLHQENDAQILVTTAESLAESQHAAASRLMSQVAGRLDDAVLYRLAAKWTAQAVAVAADLESLEILPDEIPAASGFLAFGGPNWRAQHTLAGGYQHVVAVHWHNLQDGYLGYTPYVRMVLTPDMAASDVQAAHDEYGWLLPAGGGGIHLATGEVTGDWEGASILAAALILLAQPGVTSTTIQRPERSEVKRMARSGRRAPDVRLVDLAAPKRPSTTTAPGAGTGRKLEGRRFTVGHPRNQPYGPMDVEPRPTRRIRIAGYWRGEGEIVRMPKVYELRDKPE